MRTTTKRFLSCAALSLLAATLFLNHRAARAGGLGTLIKIGGVAAAVAFFGGEINSAINAAYLRHGVESKEHTKVVAIVSIGAGTHLGAAQVVGPKDRVDQVKAVAQAEAAPGPLRLRALIPIATKSIGKGELKTVGGVGVSAIIDLKL